MGDPLTQVTLSNGLRIFVCRLRQRYAVSLNARVCSGSAAEPDAWSGVAHVLEHAVFHGTHRWPSNYALTAPLEAYGGKLFAATHTEYTSFWADAPQIAIDLALPTLLDVIRNPLLEERKLQEELQVIATEIAEYYEEGFTHVQTLLDLALWGEHPLGRPVLGRLETLASLTAGDLMQFKTRHYVPNNIVITLTGDVDTARIVDTISKHWGDWPAGRPHVPAPPRSPQAPRWALQEREGELVHLMLGLKTCPLNHPDQAVCQVIRFWLGEGMSSRLHTVLRGEAGLTYSVECTYDELRDACVLGIYMALQPDQVVTALRKVAGVLAEMTTGKITPAEAERACQTTAGRLLMQADLPRTHTRHIGLSAALTGLGQSLDTFIEQVQQVTWADLCRYGASLGVPDNRYLGAVGPVPPTLWGAIRETVFQGP